MVTKAIRIVFWAWGLNSYFKIFPKQPALESTENSQEWQKRWTGKKRGDQGAEVKWEEGPGCLCPSAAGCRHFSASAVSQVSSNYWKEWGEAGWISVFWAPTQWHLGYLRPVWITWIHWSSASLPIALTKRVTFTSIVGPGQPRIGHDVQPLDRFWRGSSGIPRHQRRARAAQSWCSVHNGPDEVPSQTGK